MVGVRVVAPNFDHGCTMRSGCIRAFAKGLIERLHKLRGDLILHAPLATEKGRRTGQQEAA